MERIVRGSDRVGALQIKTGHFLLRASLHRGHCAARRGGVGPKTKEQGVGLDKCDEFIEKKTEIFGRLMYLKKVLLRRRVI